MKKQIKRLSPHQNAKVAGILLALSVLPFLIPMLLGLYLSDPPHDNRDKVVLFMLAFFPVFYLVFEYIAMAIACALYNLLFKYIGGFEFELRDEKITQQQS